MQQCDLCLAMRKRKELVLFEDPHAVVMLHPTGTAPGHLLIMPLIHYTILEQVPDEDLRQLFRVMKLMAASLEKGIDAKNLTMVIKNGHAAGQEFPHLAIHLIPRGEGDKVNVEWKGIPIPADEMAALAARLKEACKRFTQEKKEKKEESGMAEEAVEEARGNVMPRYGRRIP